MAFIGQCAAFGVVRRDARRGVAGVMWEAKPCRDKLGFDPTGGIAKCQSLRQCIARAFLCRA